MIQSKLSKISVAEWLSAKLTAQIETFNGKVTELHANESHLNRLQSELVNQFLSGETDEPLHNANVIREERLILYRDALPVVSEKKGLVEALAGELQSCRKAALAEESSYRQKLLDANATDPENPVELRKDKELRRLSQETSNFTDLPKPSLTAEENQLPAALVAAISKELS